MKIFVDSARLDEIEQAYSYGIINGVTTNPSLLKKAVEIDKTAINSIITLSKDSSTVMYDGVSEEQWQEFDMPVYKVTRLNNEKQLIKNLSPDLVIMCGWRQIINKDLLEIPKRGFVGFHPTLLPIGRGPAPIINSILSNFKESGLTKEECDKIDCPRIKESLGYVECQVINQIKTGDHTIFIGKVLNEKLKEKQKRIYHLEDLEFKEL